MRLIELRRRLIAENVQFALYLSEANRTWLELFFDVAFLRLCGIKLLFSPLQKSVNPHRVHPQTGVYERESERLARLLAPLGSLDLRDKSVWDLRLTQEEKDKASNFLSELGDRQFIAMHVGGGFEGQRWGDENWTIVLTEIQKILPGVGLVFVGSSEDRQRSDDLGKRWSAPVLNGCGMFAPRESAAILERAYMFLGHDSGPMHLAASRGVDCVAVFGSHDPPRAWHPYGEGHEIMHNTTDIARISPDEVIRAVSRFVASHPIPSSHKPI